MRNEIHRKSRVYGVVLQLLVFCICPLCVYSQNALTGSLKFKEGIELKPAVGVRVTVSPQRSLLTLAFCISDGDGNLQDKFASQS
ncbi:MAG: hypothetical protein ACK5IQ_05190 [Bacteroidales bacterium]